MSQSSMIEEDPHGFNSITPSEVSTKWNYDYEPNQFFPQLQNVMSLSPFDNTVSGSRKQMFGASHITQALAITGSTPRRIQTGAEQWYGDATFNVQAEHDCEILQIMSLYENTELSEDRIKKSPETILIVENIGTDEDPNAREIDYIKMVDFFSNHQYFGFPYKTKEIAKQLRPGTRLKAGTILQDSPNKHDDGNYCLGRELNCVFASFDAVAEDGVILSEEALPWLEITKFEKRTVSWGSSHFPLNLYGDENNYKPLPEIGDYVRADGLLWAGRSYDNNFSMVEMAKSNLRRVNYTHDKLVYVPSGGGRVIDVRIRHDAMQTPNSPALCNAQADRYDKARREYYQKILDYYNKTLKPRFGETPPMSKKFKLLIKQAYALSQELRQDRRGGEQERVQKIYRGSPMDDYTVELVIEYKSRPKVGYKITDCWGGKGVVVKIWPKEWMPVDEEGNRAHIIMDDIATISRMNLGRLYEQYINASSRDYVKKLCAHLGMAPPEINGPRMRGRKLNQAQKTMIKELVESGEEGLLTWWAGFKQLVGIINPVTRQFYEQHVEHSTTLIAEHVCEIIEDGIYHYHPTCADPELPKMLRQLRDNFPAHKSRIKFRGNLGQEVTSRYPILIGSLYFMLLEKTGDDWNAVSSGRLQSYGILSQINNQDKYSSPWRQQAIRAWGETEVAISNSYLGWKPIAVIIDRNNNIDTHRACVKKVLSAEFPTNIDYLSDTSQIVLGGAKPLQLVNHLAQCNGWKFAYSPYSENTPKPSTINFLN